MSRGAYYNEIDPYAAAWLRNLITAGHIAYGDVDERSITEVSPVDLIGYDQCHFFAGIGVWSYALRRAGWPDDRPVWTGSCPCQPFSAAGKRGGTADERHLWPAFGGLIAQCRPRVVFGEQVASKDGLAWLDLVHADLEAAGYAVGALDLCAAGVGAPHIRQRLFFVADAGPQPARRGLCGPSEGAGEAGERAPDQPQRSGDPCELADADGGDACAEGLQRGGEHGQQPQDGGAGGALGDTDDARPQGRSLPGATGSRDGAGELAAREAGSSFWSDCDWLPCIDGKARPTQSGLFPLAHGAPARVGRLRAYGNAIVAPVAAEFIRAYRDVMAAHIYLNER